MQTTWPVGTTWAEAMAAGLHAPGAFYPRGRGPGPDFRTASSLAPDLLAEACAELLARLPEDVRSDVVEVGAGTGALLAALAGRLPSGTRLVGVEQRPRPAGLPERVEWQAHLPATVRGLVIAFEWLDTLPVDVIVAAGNSVPVDRVLVVDPDGRERPGPVPDRRTREWLSHWWPAGARREAGHRRDDAWSDAVARLTAGIAVAVDYGHVAGVRPPGGSLVGFRGGRRVGPRPDGDTDVTAHVAWDAVAAAVRRTVPDATSVLRPQREVLPSLGLSAGLPPRSRIDADALRRAGRARVLLAPAGLGSFGWLMTAVGVPPSLLPGSELPARP